MADSNSLLGPEEKPGHSASGSHLVLAIKNVRMSPTTSKLRLG